MPQCKLSSPALLRLPGCTVAARRIRLALCLLAVSPGATLSAGDVAVRPLADAREIYSAAAPQWLRAVGKLRVPGSRYSEGTRSHVQEDCSATLVSRRHGHPADTLVTAWHCLENYNDLSKGITFSLLSDQPGAVQREAYRLDDGGGMHADWALLRLRRPVAPTEVMALPVDPGRADPALPISMAGYSRDAGKGAGGDHLTFDPDCQITAQAPLGSDSNCLAHKGASGGAVMQLSPSGQARLTGVISAGDGAGLSTFVPLELFRAALNRHLPD